MDGLMSEVILKISNLNFSYTDDRKVIKNLNLEIYSGQKTAIIGHNGAGKSTLITLLNGLRTGEGEILIKGRILGRKNAGELRKEIGTVFQNPDDQLFCPTVYEDVAFGPLNAGVSKNMIKERVRMALNNVGLENYDDFLINELSYGEKKLVSIATAISLDPEIIMFDEPSSNLDAFHRRKIINWISEHKNKTILITTHDLEMVLETCSRVIILNDGKLVADGLPKQLLSDADLLKENKLEPPVSLM